MLHTRFCLFNMFVSLLGGGGTTLDNNNNNNQGFLGYITILSSNGEDSSVVDSVKI